MQCVLLIATRGGKSDEEV